MALETVRQIRSTAVLGSAPLGSDTQHKTGVCTIYIWQVGDPSGWNVGEVLVDGDGEETVFFSPDKLTNSISRHDFLDP